MMINDQEGVFSIGGTGSKIVDRVKKQMDEDLDKLGQLERSSGEVGGDQSKKKKKRRANNDDPQEEEWTSKYKWTKVQGAAGFWQILMQGVWVNNKKVLKNQPVIIDV